MDALITFARGYYARVSMEQQAKEHTIASQTEAIRQRVLGDGLECEPELCFARRRVQRGDS